MRATSQKLQFSKISPNLESLCTAATKRNRNKSQQVFKAWIIFLERIQKLSCSQLRGSNTNIFEGIWVTSSTQLRWHWAGFLQRVSQPNSQSPSTCVLTMDRSLQPQGPLQPHRLDPHCGKELDEVTHVPTGVSNQILLVLILTHLLV